MFYESVSFSLTCSVAASYMQRGIAYRYAGEFAKYVTDLKTAIRLGLGAAREILELDGISV
jgi:hypothetical protein